MTPLLWLYWPVRNVAREGQQREKETKLFSNVVPGATSRRWTLAITRSDSTVWSSVITTTTFGRRGTCAVAGSAASQAAGEQDGGNGGGGDSGKRERTAHRTG
jgi:hypothetical protein